MNPYQLIAFLCLFTFSFSQVQAQDFTIDAFEVEIEIDEAGFAHIKEHVTVDFSEKRRGIFRSIPYLFKVNGERYKTKISDVQVPSHKFKVTRKGNDVIIRIGDKNVYVEGRQEYIVSYTVEDAYVAYQDHQEFYWNITGNDTKTSIDHASFKVTLPKGISLAIDDIKVFTGKENSTENKGRIQQIDERTIEGANTEKLQAREGMTIALRLPVDYLDNVNKITDIGIKEKKRTDDSPIWSLIPASLMALFFIFWRRLRTKHVGHSDIQEQFYPPEGLTSAHVGAFIDHTVNDRDLISLIPYWGSEGFIKVVQEEDNTTLEKIKDLPINFPKYEIKFFNEIFKDGDRAYISSFQDKFYSTFVKIKSELSAEVKEQGYYDEEYRSIFRTWRWVLTLLAIAVSGILLIVLFKYLFLGIGFLLFALFAMVISLFRSPMSERGHRIHEKLLGLRSFLKNPDGDQISQLMKENPKYFEQMLPFAVAFGIDKSWTKSFETYYDYAPIWYYSSLQGNRPSFSSFTSDFAPKEISSAFSSYPASTGGGSGGGGISGGSSGGGFGGGGTGSW